MAGAYLIIAVAVIVIGLLIMVGIIRTLNAVFSLFDKDKRGDL